MKLTNSVNQEVQERTHTSPHILTLDIETAPLQSYHWGLWDQNVGLDMIQDEWSILSFSAKWLGKSNVIYMDTGGRGVDKVRDDMAVLEALWGLLDNADIVVAQNGLAFDIKKINSRFLLAGLPPYSPIRVVDTMLVAKKHFNFTSNKLAWMSQHITNSKKSTHKLFPGFELWAECLKDNKKAWAEMKKYNVMDTVATEELYLKMLPWIGGHPNVATYTDSENASCPKCNSDNLQKRGLYHTQTGVFQRYCCVKCKGWSKGRNSILTREKRKALLGN